MEDAGQQLVTLATIAESQWSLKGKVIPTALLWKEVGNLKAYSCTCIQCSFPGYHYKGYSVMLRNPQGIPHTVTLASNMLSTVIEEPIGAQNGEKIISGKCDRFFVITIHFSRARKSRS